MVGVLTLLGVAPSQITKKLVVVSATIVSALS
jgi:hypothetical protein